VYTAITVFKYMTEEREKKKIKGAFSYYVNQSVVTEMLKNPDMLKLGGEKRFMTVLFSDIRGFTTIPKRWTRRPWSIC
jgi:adenylate cyclase